MVTHTYIHTHTHTHTTTTVTLAVRMCTEVNYIMCNAPLQGKEGGFVVRNSSRENMYTLSIW